MAKSKSKKIVGLADKLHAKKSKDKFKKVLNPFEVHINKEKFKILGKKTKNDRGLPGVSRAKAIKKRKNTLGYELKLVNKSNTFLDKRIGEKNVALTEEEKIMARFAAEKIHQHKAKTGKQSIYNLAEEEVLTHRGQTLEEIEKFDDPRSEDEDEEINSGKFGHLRENFVSDANFGGGVLSRSENNDGARSRKDLIEQLIIESKKRKLEKQKLKEETLDLTEKLDTEWKDLHPVVSKTYNKEVEKPVAKEPLSLIDKLLIAHEKKDEDYDKTMRELKFEPRGTPSDRLKSEDEIAKIEKDKLEKLEKDRLARMHGVADIGKIETKSKHRSADDLDDGYVVDSDPELVIAYNKEGKLLMPITKEPNKNSNQDDNEDDAKSDNDNEENGEDNNDAEEDEDSDDSLDDLRIAEESSNDEEENESTTEAKFDDDIEQTENTEDIKKSKKSVSFSFEESETKPTNNEHKSILVNRKRKISDENNDKIEAKVTCQDPDKIKNNLLAKKEMMEKAAKELPYTYEMPKSYEDLAELLERQLPIYQFIIVERIIKCNHPSLGEGNKKKLSTFFAYLLQYANDLFAEDALTNEDGIKHAFECFDRLLSHYYRLAQMDPENAKSCLLEVIREKYGDYKQRPKVFPSMDTIIFFKLVSALFSTSDLKHPVVTPCFYFISQILTNTKLKSSVDVSRGLFLVTIILEYTALSKRFLPAAVNYVRGVLSLCVQPSSHNKIKVLPPFKLNTISTNILQITSKVNCSISNENMLAKYLILDDNSEDFKVRTLITSLKLFESLFKQADHLNCQRPLFEPHYSAIVEINKSNYPTKAIDLIDRIKSSVEETFKNRSLKLIIEESKPKQLRFYEPDVEDVFSGKKKRVMSKEKQEYQKLVYKHKKEMKGAMREIRRDKSYISSVKIKEKIRSDNIRKEKVKQIYSEASLQQGELNALTRSKKKKK